MLLGYAVQNGMLIHQMDAITAFLNGELKEEMYMRQPDGMLYLAKSIWCASLKSLSMA